MILPSNELLSAVFGNCIVKAIDSNETDKSVKPNDLACLAHSLDGIAFEENINKYELMHLMKEWLHKKNRILFVFNSTSTDSYCATLDDETSFIERTEFEVVLKCCELVLKS